MKTIITIPILECRTNTEFNFALANFLCILLLNYFSALLSDDVCICTLYKLIYL